jgi:hypothetical protein
MATAINAFDHDLQKNIPINLDQFPDKCPICNRHVKPILLAAHLLSTGFRPLHVAFICPALDCGSMFIGSYRVWKSPADKSTTNLSQTQVLRYVEEVKFPQTIQTISPLFCATYNQALRAEENGLDQICGPDYRKALEYLVKDYLLTYRFKEDKKTHETVLRTQLGTCIDRYIDEERIKAVAKRAAWLGNDETHYYRKWTEKDVADLKVLVSMTVSWIDLLVQSDAYIKEMPE